MAQKVHVFLAAIPPYYRLISIRKVKTSLLLYRYTLTPNMKDWSFMEMYIHVRDDMNQVLAFNPNTYGKFEPVRNIQPGT